MEYKANKGLEHFFMAQDTPLQHGTWCIHIETEHFWSWYSAQIDIFWLWDPCQYL